MTRSLALLPLPGSSRLADAWHLRARTLAAMLRLAAARVRIGLVPLERWRDRVGLAGDATEAELAEARRLARHVERAAGRLPFETKCLPRALALGTTLRRRGIAHRLVLAARPAGARSGKDDLHAWVEVAGRIVIGDLPGPWAILFRHPAGAEPQLT